MFGEMWSEEVSTTKTQGIIISVIYEKVKSILYLHSSIYIIGINHKIRQSYKNKN